MGNCMTAEEKERREEWKQEELERFVEEIREDPNLRVNDSIMKFTSLDSSENLREHYERRKKDAGDRVADIIKKLVEKLGPLTPAPALAGLGALAIAILIDVEFCSPSSTQDALRSVFAEEKISKVWDQIDECLKRYMMNINNQDELVTDMRRIEHKLSAALTKLKNSMLRDGHMSSEALKAWVNGAAFHIQMRIHLVRLGGSQTCDPIKQLLSIYKKDLDPLFEKHKKMIKKKCSRRVVPAYMAPSAVYLVGEDSQCHSINIFLVSYKTYVEAYYNHRYSRQKHDIQQYFSDVGQNLQELIDQTGSFNIT